MAQHALHVLDTTGDTVLTFDDTDAAAVIKVRAEFDRLVSQEHHLAYTVSGPQRSDHP
jgi:hypothetical protein